MFSLNLIFYNIYLVRKLVPKNGIKYKIYFILLILPWDQHLHLHKAFLQHQPEQKIPLTFSFLEFFLFYRLPSFEIRKKYHFTGSNRGF